MDVDLPLVVQEDFSSTKHNITCLVWFGFMVYQPLLVI